SDVLYQITAHGDLWLNYDKLCSEAGKTLVKALSINYTLKKFELKIKKSFNASGKALAETLCNNITQ
ncbi:14839_t:CDS:1, partial [Gigaspora rosea]